MKVIKKVVIPAAGLGTRFLPATKAQPKEMLPLVDKPVIQYIVEEAVASGIETVVIIIGQNKSSLEDHFSSMEGLERWLEKTGKLKELEEIRKIFQMADFVFIRQKGVYGNGTPILNAQSVVGKEPFAVIWADDLVIAEKPRLQQLIEVYARYDSPVLTAYRVDEEGTRKYGIIEGDLIDSSVWRIKTIIEKPGPDKTSSRIASLGGYILTPDIFDALREIKPGKDNELWLVDGIFALSRKRPIYARLIEGKYYDVGSKLGWLIANIELGLKSEEIGEQLRDYLKKMRLP